MRPVLSPAESLGLSGATLEGRVRRAAHHVADPTFARIADRLRTDAWANAMIYERDGEKEPIRIMLRPLLAMSEQLDYVHYVCLRLTEALKVLPQLYLDDEKVRKIIAISPEEESWLRASWTQDHLRANPVYGRLDAVCDFTGQAWRDSLRFMEANLAGVGGIYFTPVAEQLVMRDVVPTLRAHDPELTIELPRDQRDLFLQVLVDHSRGIGRDQCRFCFVEPKYVHDGPDEQAVLAEYLASRYGATITHADPRELHLKDGDVFYEDTPVDVAYRDYELRELAALENELGKPLDAMRMLFRENRVISSLVGDFDHKSVFEILTDEAISAKLFSADDRRLFRRHVLWTRIAGERRTTLPNGRSGELLEYARMNREQLVLKPNREYGGTGVMIGSATDQKDWEKQLNEAAALADDPSSSWVVQAATRLPVHEFPVVGADGRVFGEPFYSVMGFAATENGLGTMCRVSQKQVVNVAQRGGLAAVLEAEAPPELLIPKRSLQRNEGIENLLRAQICELRHMDHAIALLGWDEETMLPAAGRPERGDQLAMLEGIRHMMLVSDRLGDLVEEVDAHADGNESLKREIVLLRRLRRNAIALPDELVRHYAKAKSHSLGAWEDARVRNDYSVFAGPFEELLGLIRERASALAAGGDTYDALLDEFEQDMTRSRLDPVLDDVRNRLVPLVKEASAASAGQPARGARLSDSAQGELCRHVLAKIGFEFERGRLDRSTHPFTLFAGAHDIRLTIRVREEDLTAAVLTVLHEGGHGLYDQGFAESDRDSLLGDAPSMGLHESQSRLWENHVGRSAAFWEFLFPSIKKLVPDGANGLDPSGLHRMVNLVQPGTNRVDADEMSYHLHIVMRYELELALLSGALSAADLPAAWNERSEKLLGARPASDREGVLQDVHWSLGMFGYFPTYTLGSLYAAQFAETYERDHPFQAEVKRGDFRGLLGWLRRNVHQVGQRVSAEGIVTRATGRGLDAAAFFRYLGAKSAALKA
jgi:carboxypeptidase Taq